MLKRKQTQVIYFEAKCFIPTLTIVKNDGEEEDHLVLSVDKNERVWYACV